MLVLGLAALPLIGCKAKRGSDAPGVDVRNWTLAEIEAELERNDHVLADEGIMVAMGSSTANPVEATPSTPLEGPEPELEAQPEAYDDDGGEAAPPQPESPQPEPRNAEPSAAYESEDAPATRRDRSERRSAARADNRETSSRCERVCELAAATCELETQICELAERHPDEPRYTQACQRAEQQCLAASQACQRCED